MENRINISELLKDCPKGMELYSPLCGECKLYDVNDYNIRIETLNKDTLICLYHDGRYCANGEIMLFPKGKTTWEGFQKPFKDGDVISDGMFIAIFHKFKEGHLYYRCWYHLKNNTFKVKIDYGIGCIKEYRYATKEEKAKLFQAIKDNGYKWNEETKTLEKLPKFKVGDRLIYIHDKEMYMNEPIYVKRIECNRYILNNGKYIPFYDQDDFELAPNKFDITNLKPFDKVLVRDYDNGMWCASIFSHTWRDKYFCICIWHNQCIPYEGNEHLLGTTDDCDEYFKNW